MDSDPERSARIVSFSSAKGGSGKTVTCISVGRVLAELGAEVLMVDADADTAGMTLLFLDDVLAARDNDLTRETPNGGLFDPQAPGSHSFLLTPVEARLTLLPTQYELNVINVTGARADIASRLAALVRVFESSYDYILLDAQAGADDVAIAAATAADEVVIVCEYDPISAQGVRRLEQMYPTAFHVAKTWILYNKVLSEVAESIGNLLSFDRRLTPLPWDREVVRAYVQRTVPVDMRAPNSYTLAVVSSVEILMGRRMRKQIADWRRSAATALRAPLGDQLRRIERDIDNLETERIELRLAIETRRARTAILSVAAIATALLSAIGVLLAVSLSRSPNGWQLGFAGACAAMAAFLATSMSPGLMRYRRRRAHDELALVRLERQLSSLAAERERIATSVSPLDGSDALPS
jgi:cellulose biosynthesis protein BcsQ